MTTSRVTRRTFLHTVVAGAAVVGAPRSLRAQAKTFKIGAVHPVTGPLAEPGQACRLGRADGGRCDQRRGRHQGKGGMQARADPRRHADQARERPRRGRARRLLGRPDAARARSTPAPPTPWCRSPSRSGCRSWSTSPRPTDHRQRGQVGEGRPAEGPVRLPQLPDRLVVRPQGRAVLHRDLRRGQDHAQARRPRCTATTCSARTSRAASWPPTRPPSRRGQLLEDDVIAWPEPPTDLSTEVSKLKSLKPDVIAPITRPASALLLLPEIRKQRIEIARHRRPGQPGLLRGGAARRPQGRPRVRAHARAVGELQEPQDPAVADDYKKRSSGKTFDTNSGYSYDAVFVIADALERTTSLDDPDAIVDALKKTNYAAGLMQYGGPVRSTRSATTPTPSPP